MDADKHCELLKSSAQGQMVARRTGDLEERFSPGAICFCWFCFVSLHMAGFVYYRFSAWCYWNLPGTHLDQWLTLFSLGMGTQHHRTIAAFMGLVAIIHGIYMVWMIVWSFKKKQFVFAVYNVFHIPKCLQSAAIRRRSKLVHPNGATNFVYRALFTRDGLLGVDGPYFKTILFGREVIETALQTHQAYRMSVLLPREKINRSYIALLVINCWMTTLLHSLFQKKSTKRRVWSLISDCVLDTVTSMGISTMLLASYVGDFNFRRAGFPAHKWYEDIWVVQSVSEFQMILVTSWRDLCTRMIFALSLMGDMDNMKMAMRARRRGNSSNTPRANRATMIAPYFSSMKSKKGPSVDLLLKQRRRGLLSKLSQFVFFWWGLAVLTLHLYADTAPQFPQCWMQVRPWMTSQASCSLLILDCHENQVNGTKNEVAEQWNSFDPTSVTRVVVRHCPTLELPEQISHFSSLDAIKIYNTTIASSDSGAAITQARHPNFMTLFLVRVSFPNGELPTGLHAPNFPQSVTDIEICFTNLRTLPHDVDMKWPEYASIYIEASQLEEVPVSLVRLAPFDLSLSMNPITELPGELFEQDSVTYLSFGGTRISQLPPNVSKLSSQLCDVNLSYNNLSFLWPWIDPIIGQGAGYPPLALAGTPYCRKLERIYAGQQTSFSLIPSMSSETAKLSVFSDASVGNWVNLKKGITCDEQPKTWYPIDFEDAYSGLR